MSTKEQQEPRLLESFNVLFYFCKLLGVYPQEWRSFREEKRLRKSFIGSGIVAIVIYVIFVCYNIMVFTFDDLDFRSSLNNLNLLISWALTYSSPMLMITDLASAIYFQHKLDRLTQNIDAVDAALHRHKISLCNSHLKRRICLMIFLALMWELSSFLITCIFMETERFAALLWVFSCVPTFFDSLDKIWFVGLMMALRYRFAMLNDAIDEVVQSHEGAKVNRRLALKIHPKKIPLHETIRFHKVQPVLQYDQLFGERVAPARVPPYDLPAASPVPRRSASDKRNILNNADAFEDKMMEFCQLHDSLCELGRELNEIWRFSLLLMMGYGFVIFTAHLYFTFCAITDQAIPSMFRLAKMPLVTLFYLMYIASKSIVLMYCSWATSQESKRTGICLHRCAVASNTNGIYEVVNHLSLKLLNHRVNFSACGLFSLDMSTLFAITGGITSYVIIFIQFNMAGQQAKNFASLASASSSSAIPENSTTNLFEFVWYLPKA